MNLQNLLFAHHELREMLVLWILIYLYVVLLQRTNILSTRK